MNITDEVFYDMVNYIQKNYGINLKNKKNLIVGRLENYLVRNGYKDYREYMEIVKNDKKVLIFLHSYANIYLFNV